MVGDEEDKELWVFFLLMILTEKGEAGNVCKDDQIGRNVIILSIDLTVK